MVMADGRALACEIQPCAPNGLPPLWVPWMRAPQVTISPHWAMN